MTGEKRVVWALTRVLTPKGKKKEKKGENRGQAVPTFSRAPVSCRCSCFSAASSRSIASLVSTFLTMISCALGHSRCSASSTDPSTSMSTMPELTSAFLPLGMGADTPTMTVQCLAICCAARASSPGSVRSSRAS